MNWEIIITVISTLGGFEGIKWWMNRKTNARMLDIKADSDEFHLLRDRLDTADRHLLEKEKQLYEKEKQLYEKEQRFHEQTLMVREIQKQLLDKTQENGELKAEISALKAERAMKLCERRGCINREPQSGY